MLGYLASDGRPLVAPVWFVVDNGAVAFNTGKDTAKGRAIVRDPRVVMCVDDPHPPYSFVQIQGVAAISEDPKDLLDIATRTGGRYMGADRAEEFGVATGCLANSSYGSRRPRCSAPSTWRTDAAHHETWATQ